MNLTIRGYLPGDEKRQADLDHRITKTWEWPSAYPLSHLERFYSAPDFDPESVQFALVGEEMVGFTRRWWAEAAVDGSRTSFLLFPKVLPGHEKARAPLLERLMAWERSQGTRTIQVWGCTMWPESFDWLEARGFAESPDLPRGYRIYMSYGVENGPLPVPTDWVKQVRTEEEMDAAADLARIWHKDSLSRSKERLQELLDTGRAMAHFIVEQNSVYTGCCIVARNPIRASVAAAYSIFAAQPQALRQLLARSINTCIEHNCQRFLAELSAEHRHFEPTYVDLGFTKGIEYAMYEKQIA